MSNELDDFLSKLNSTGVLSKPNAKVKEISHIHNFIVDNDIKVGKFAVPPKYIYGLYCEQQRPPIKPKTFSKYFRTFFKKGFSADKVFYRLDPVPFKMPAGYTLWKEMNLSKFQYKKTKYSNIKSTPDGWMVYLEFTEGRKIFTFLPSEKKAAGLADRLAVFYFGENYPKLNFKNRILLEDESLLHILQGKQTSNEQNKKS